jgi:hypothetical protein
MWDLLPVMGTRVTVGRNRMDMVGYQNGNNVRKRAKADTHSQT